MKSATIVLAAFVSLAFAVPGKQRVHSSDVKEDDNKVFGKELELCDALDAKVIDKNKCRTDAQNCIDKLGASPKPEEGVNDKQILEQVKDCLFVEKKYINPKGDTIRNYLAQYTLENEKDKPLLLSCGKHDNDNKHMKCKLIHESVAANTQNPFEGECHNGKCHLFRDIIRDCENSKSGCTNCTHEGIEQFSPKSRTFQCDHDPSE